MFAQEYDKERAKRGGDAAQEERSFIAMMDDLRRPCH